MVDNRKKQLLEYLIREYIHTAEPVGSGVLVDKYNLEVSSATVRNDLAELEKEGLIFQPHTSAGRIPTEKGFQNFIDQFISEKELNGEEKDIIKKILEDKQDEEFKIKNLAKVIARISNEAIIVAFDLNNVYYTGISNIFSKPEFKNKEILINISDVIDKLDEIIPTIYNKFSEEPKILLGKNNPFGNECASILMRNDNILIGILGLIRMNYEKNLSLMNFIRNNL